MSEDGDFLNPDSIGIDKGDPISSTKNSRPSSYCKCDTIRCDSFIPVYEVIFVIGL